MLLGGIPATGITGAAIATIVGQTSAMFITQYYVAKAYDLHGHFSLCQAASIYKSGFLSIVMQSLYTVYIVGLNILLKGFTEDAGLFWVFIITCRVFPLSHLSQV